MTDLAIPGMGYAYANYGRWVVDCPRPFCSNAMQVDRWQERFECLGMDSCGYSSPITWPADPEGIETLLKMRPAKATRNWLLGETLEDLLAENTLHGCMPPDWLEISDRPVMQTVNGVITGGLMLEALPPGRNLAQIGA